MAANVSQDVFQPAMAFTTWADQQIVQVARQLTTAQFEAAQPSGVKTIHATLAHMLGAQQTWIRRWNGSSPARLADATDYPTLESIATAWTDTHRDLEAFVAAGIDPQRLITYKTTKGIEYTYPLGMLVWHVVNHSTQHRSEAAAMCSAVGHSPGDLDILVYLRQIFPKTDA